MWSLKRLRGEVTPAYTHTHTHAGRGGGGEELCLMISGLLEVIVAVVMNRVSK